MANVEETKFYFERKNYFSRFAPTDSRAEPSPAAIDRSIRHALEYFVDDLRHDRNKTIERFLAEQNVNDIFRCLAQLLLNENDRTCGNSAYIIGSAVEFEQGLARFIDVFCGDRTANTVDIIRILCHLLTHADSECAMNAAGTLGTICGSKLGRQAILNHACMSQTITNTAALLSSTNSWIASNAALVLARITVEELGCQAILTHPKHGEILKQILAGLDVSDPGRSTNAAFALGRLVEADEGKKIFVASCGQYKIFDALLLMLERNEEKGVSKNACYAMSCLCTTHFGYQLCLQYMETFRRIVLAIEAILSTGEQETVWFALMCLRTIVQYDGASEHICHSNTLIDKLIRMREAWAAHTDIQEEAKMLWYMIHRNIKPSRPKIEERLITSADISWEISVHSWDDDQLRFRILLNDRPVAQTSTTSYQLKDLQPNTSYYVQIQYITPQGDNIPSDPVMLHTDDDLPPPVNNLHVERTTMTAARVAWEPPDLTACNSLRGYQTYLNEEEHEYTTECEMTFGSLSARTSYQIDVCAVTNKGKGPLSSISVITAAAGDCNPAPPTFSIIGRREVYVKWQPPEVIAGRLTRYELFCNRQSVYSGTAQEYRVTRLKTDTEYTMEVVAFTSEGRFRSKPARTRTAKDEFSNAHRHSLYEPLSQSPPRSRRTDTVSSLHSSGTQASHSKASSTTGRSPVKEAPTASRNTDFTTMQSVQFKSDNPSHPRFLPLLNKGVQPRAPELIKRRDVQRYRSEPIPIQQLQPQMTRTAPSVISPVLEVDRQSHARWVSPVRQSAAPTAAFRVSATTRSSLTLADAQHFERSFSTSLPDLPANASRVQS